MESSDTSTCVGSYKIVVHSDTALDKTLVMIDFADLAKFVEWAGGRKAVAEVLPGLGDAAFLGPKGAEEYSIVGFRKGDRAIRVAAGSGGDEVTTAQLEQIAELIASRLE